MDAHIHKEIDDLGYTVIQSIEENGAFFTVYKIVDRRSSNSGPGALVLPPGIQNFYSSGHHESGPKTPSVAAAKAWLTFLVHFNSGKLELDANGSWGLLDFKSPDHMFGVMRMLELCYELARLRSAGRLPVAKRTVKIQ